MVTIAQTFYSPAERLPERGEPVLVKTSEGWEIAAFVDGDWRYRDEEGESIEGPILFWADMPQIAA